MTLFVTIEYLNKILLNEKGFENFPEKFNYFSWKDEEEKDNGVALLESSNYNQLLNFLLQFINNKSFTQKFIANSLSNLISQLIRIIWNEVGPISFLLEQIYENLMKNVNITI